MSSAATAHAFWITQPNRGAILEQELPPPASGEARIRTLYSAISRGTELLVYRGGVPESEYARMRAPFQEGDFPGPVKYGYINVGIVEQGPDRWRGKHTFCLYPHQTRYNAPLNALHRIPRTVPLPRAILAANMETALNALWDARLRRGSRLSVVGAGAVGCLCAWLARRQYSADVELVDIDLARAPIAAALGVEFALPSQASGEAPVVIHTSATQDGLRTALSLSAFEGLVLELSWYGNEEPRVPLGAAFHSRRLTIKSSQVGHIAAPMRRRGRVTHRSRLRRALQLLNDPALDALIDSNGHFEELPQLMAALASGERRAICHRIHYDEAGDRDV